MSSRTKRSHGHNWSEWAQDDANSQWYRARMRADGTYTYEYQSYPTQGTPRSESSSATATASHYQDTSSSNQYYSTNNYGYSGSQQPATSVDALSRDFSSININASSGSNEYYNASASSSEIASTSAQPIPIQSPLASSTGYPYISTAATGGYMGSYGGQARSAFYPASSPSYYQAGQAPQESSYGDYAADSTNNSYASTIVPNLYSGGKEATSADYESSNESNVVIPKDDIHKRIKGTKGKEEKLDKRYRVHSSKHFKAGQVFKVLWSEPKGESQRPSSTAVTEYYIGETKYGQPAYQSIRRFVIVAADDGHCQCLPILTYQGQGTLKGGAKGYNHAIIYACDNPTEGPPAAEVGEDLSKEPIRMIPKTPRDKLDAQSRLNYAKIYTVEHNVKVWFIGEIAPESTHRLVTDFDETWNAKRQIATDSYYT